MNILDVVSVNDLLSDISYLEEALNKARSNQSFLTYLELAEVKMGGNSSKHAIKTKPAITQTVTRTVVEEPKVETAVAEEVKEEPKEITFDTEKLGLLEKRECDIRLIKPFDTATLEDSESYILAYK